MAPRPEDDDLVIEPPDEEGIVYGNSTMEGTSTGQRPYIRLTSQLRNVTRNAGGEVRFRCEALGTPPLHFIWLKNHGPIEKSKKVRIKDKETSSRLLISSLDVLDSGYYQCVVSNSAASVNTTSVLRVNNVPEAVSKSRKPSGSIVEDYEDYELMDRGRLPDEEDADLFRVPDTAAGGNFASVGVSERWLDGIKYRVGDCVIYKGEACRQFLSNRMVMMTNESREEMYDIDRNLRAAMLFINSAPSVSHKCRQLSQAVACHHMYKICDGDNTKSIVGVCKNDCENIQKKECASEFALAAAHELVGDGPKALFPDCSTLSTTSNCIPVSESPSSMSPGQPSDVRKGHLTHWCYVDSGKHYEGSVASTVSGKQCMNWADSSSRDFNVDRFPELAQSKNYCRNPGGRKTRPWCYSQPLGQEEYCNVPQCPKDMYPHLSEKGQGESNSLGDSMAALWDSLDSTSQLAVVGGGVFLSLLLLLVFCCACCCRSKKNKAQKGRQQPQTHHLNGHSNAPSSIVNRYETENAANSAYYRKLNGTSTPIMGTRGTTGPVEMNGMLGPNGPTTHLGPPNYPVPQPYHVDDHPYHVLEISPNQINVRELIGEGQFGMVHSGVWTGGLVSREPLTVALKSCRIDSTNAERASLEQEIRTVASFDHPHVIRLLGVSYIEGNLTAVFEYMVHGDLHDLLRLRAPSGCENELERIQADNEDFLRIATQIAYGMEYLASMSYVHRDLATRNCLVGDNRVIKIADFGLMRACYDNDYYKMLHRSWMPVRWMSKEALEQGRFSEASDVWSFGVTLWEVWSYGRQPYEGASHQQVIEMIDNRHLLDCPPNCPTNIYSLMVECWHENVDRRPTFSEMHSRLQSWAMASPAHSMLQHRAPSNSGSSGAGRPTMKGTSIPPRGGAVSYQASRPPRRGEDASPLMRREANYAYSEDGDSD